jgi:peptide/nickel transport system permease protein
VTPPSRVTPPGLAPRATDAPPRDAGWSGDRPSGARAIAGRGFIARVFSARLFGACLLGAIIAAAIGASYVAPYDPTAQFRDHLLAPPMSIRLRDADGHWRAPFIYPLRVVNRLERTFVEDRTHPVPLRLFANGRLLGPETDAYGPWLVLGSDHLGRDLYSRLVYGAQLSLGVAAIAVTGALFIGIVLGAIAAMSGGVIDIAISRASEFVLVLPALYVVIGLRSTLPPALPAATVFLLVTILLAAIDWPTVARGVRTIVNTESTREYAMAARAVGASPWWLLTRHLLPATFGFLRVQALMLLPAAILAESTLSYAGLGFDADRPSWGTLLQEASDIRALADYPWLLSAAGAIVLVVLGLNLLLEADRRPIVTAGDAHAPLGRVG